MFKKQPFNMEVLRPSAVHVIAVPYTRSDDEVTDRANADAEIAKNLLLFDTTWATKNGGIKEMTTGVVAGITSIAAGNAVLGYPGGSGYIAASTDIVIKMSGAWEASASARRCKVVVEYNGVPVPLSDYSCLGDGYTASGTSPIGGGQVIVINNTSGKYALTAANWKVTIYGPLLGLVEVDMAGKPLPQTTTQHKLLGIEDPAFERTVKDGGPGSGSFTVIENVGTMRVARGAGSSAPAEVLNYPGEDLEKALFGSNWTAGSANALTYQSDSISFAVVVVYFNGSFPTLHTATAADQGKHFATVYLHYGCRITEMQNLQNAKADSGDMIQRQVSLEWREVYKRIFKTAS